MARDWAAEFRQIGNEENEEWSAYIEAMARKTEASAGNGKPTEDVLAKADEAHQRLRTRWPKAELMNDLRTSQS